MSTESNSRNSKVDSLGKIAPEEGTGAKPKKRIRPEEDTTFNPYSVLSDMEEDIPSSHVFERSVPRLKR